MESEINMAQTEPQKRAPKPFSIESLIGTTRKSPEIDIENNLSEHSRNSDEESDDVSRMRYIFNRPFLHQGANFPFLLGYPEPWLSRMLVPGTDNVPDAGDKRDSPLSVGSDMDSDGGEDNTQGITLTYIIGPMKCLLGRVGKRSA